MHSMDNLLYTDVKEPSLHIKLLLLELQAQFRLERYEGAPR